MDDCEIPSAKCMPKENDCSLTFSLILSLFVDSFSSSQHGVGNWTAILMDPEYFPRLFKAKYKTRCPDDLKNRFRLFNAEVYHEHVSRPTNSTYDLKKRGRSFCVESCSDQS